MSQPQQHQSPNTKGPQGDEQEQLQYPGDEGKRPPLVQPDAAELLQGFPQNVQGDSQLGLLQDLPEHKPGDGDKETSDGDRKKER